MEFKIHHPEKDSLDFVKSSVAQDHPLRRSPHVGNVCGDELDLIFGLSNMGAEIELEMVDTVQGNDKYSSPRHLITNEGSIALASNRASKGKVIGKCFVNEEGAYTASELSPDIEISTGMSLKDIHMQSLSEILPDSVSLGLSSEYFSSIGRELFSVVMSMSHDIINRPLRLAGPDGKINTTEDPDFDNIFGSGENKDEGLLPPLEAMLAIEGVEACLRQGGNDCQVSHIAGADMAEYTKNDEIVSSAKRIAQHTLDSIGIGQNALIDYIAPSREHIINSGDFASPIDKNICSQYDLLLGAQLTSR